MKRSIIFLAFASTILLSGLCFQAQASSVSQNINDAYNQYAAIDKALINDNAKDAAKAASLLLTALKDVKGTADAIKYATLISHSKDIADQRKAFASLTLSMRDLFKSNKPDKMLYIHYCPMAKAYWMDESKDIQNPYFGKDMLSCGKTTGMIM